MKTNISNISFDNEVKHTIHFGPRPFKVNEWLYNYFNSVKNKQRLYQRLYKILTGVKK